MEEVLSLWRQVFNLSGQGEILSYVVHDVC